MLGAAPGIPKILGRYRLGEFIGAGGMGQVFRAADEHLADREVAIKLLPTGTLTDPATRRQLRHEAVALSKLNHPNIAAVLDFDTQDGVDYLVMEYVPGVTLTTKLMTGPLPVKRAIDLAIQLGEGLATAHDRGIIHYDLKPGNLRITPEGRLKILDFGLAKLARTTDDKTITEAHGLAGTIAYIDPELLQGHEVGEKSDIYGVGAVLYEMVTGQWPYKEALSPKLLTAIMHASPRPASDINPDVPAELSRIISKCLAKSAAERYRSVHEVIEDLRQLRRTPVAQEWKPATRPWRRAVLALAFIAVIAAVGYYFWPKPQPVRVFIADFKTSGAEPVFDRAVRESLEISLRQSKFVTVLSRSRAIEVLERMKKGGLLRIEDENAREVCERENVKVLLAGSVNRLGDNLYVNLEGTDAFSGTHLFSDQGIFKLSDLSPSKLDSFASRIRRHLGESSSKIKETNRSLAEVTTASMEALDLYTRARDLYRVKKSPDVENLLKSALKLDPNFAMAYRLLGEYYGFGVGRNTQSEQALKKAYELRETVSEPERLSIEAAYFNLEEQYQDELQALLGLLAYDPDDLQNRWMLARAYFNLTDFKQAIRQYKEILARDPEYAMAYPMLIQALLRDQQPGEAMSVYGEAKKHKINDYRLEWAHGLAQLAMERVNDARRSFQTMVDGDSEEFRERGKFYLAVTDTYEGKLTAARNSLDLMGDKGLLIANRYFILGRIALLQGDPNSALKYATLLASIPAKQNFAYHDAGILFARAGNQQAAQAMLAILDESRKKYPAGTRENWYQKLLGEIELARGDYENSIKAFTMAKQIEPNDPIPSFGLARAYDKLNDPQHAAEALDQYLRAKAEVFRTDFPAEIAVARLQLAEDYARLGRTAESRILYQQVLQQLNQGDVFWVRTRATQELANPGIAK